MLIENETVKKVHNDGIVQHTLADEKQGLKTLEVWLLTLPPGARPRPTNITGRWSL